MSPLHDGLSASIRLASSSLSGLAGQMQGLTDMLHEVFLGFGEPEGWVVGTCCGEPSEIGPFPVITVHDEMTIDLDLEGVLLDPGARVEIRSPDGAVLMWHHIEICPPPRPLLGD